jgi:hypothetical protein
MMSAWVLSLVALIGNADVPEGRGDIASLQLDVRVRLLLFLMQDLVCDRVAGLEGRLTQ